MKHLISLVLLIALSLFFISCDSAVTNPDDAQISTLSKKPAPSLTGITDVPFNFPPRLDPVSGLPIFWEGTVKFGNETYGLYFISHGEPRDYSQASPFYEDFIIHEFGNSGNVYVEGWNAGVVTYANKDPNPVNFHANGKITHASGPFEGWNGRNVHIKGLVYWVVEGLPEIAKGEMRIN